MDQGRSGTQSENTRRRLLKDQEIERLDQISQAVQEGRAKIKHLKETQAKKKADEDKQNEEQTRRCTRGQYGVVVFLLILWSILGVVQPISKSSLSDELTPFITFVLTIGTFWIVKKFKLDRVIQL